MVKTKGRTKEWRYYILARRIGRFALIYRVRAPGTNVSSGAAGCRRQRNWTIIETGEHVSRKTTDAMISDPPLVRIDHGAMIARAAPVIASCEVI